MRRTGWRRKQSAQAQSRNRTNHILTTHSIRQRVVIQRVVIQFAAFPWGSGYQEEIMNRTKTNVAATLALAISFIAVTPCMAQEARATLSGTITDPSGSTMVGA